MLGTPWKTHARQSTYLGLKLFLRRSLALQKVESSTFRLSAFSQVVSWEPAKFGSRSKVPFLRSDGLRTKRSRQPRSPEWRHPASWESPSVPNGTATANGEAGKRPRQHRHPVRDGPSRLAAIRISGIARRRLRHRSAAMSESELLHRRGAGVVEL